MGSVPAAPMAGHLAEPPRASLAAARRVTPPRGDDDDQGKGKKRVLYFTCTTPVRDDLDSETYVWHNLSVHDDDDAWRDTRDRDLPKNPPMALPIPPQKLWLGGVLVSLGSSIYLVGISCRPKICLDFDPEIHETKHAHGIAFVCDVQRDSKTWRKSHMSLPRSSPAAVAHGGKIYAFGGCGYRKWEPFGEVYDPQTQFWKPISSTPPEPLFKKELINVRNLCVAGCWLEGKSKILLHLVTQKELYAYDVEGDSWECVDSEFGGLHTQMLAVDDVLYTLSHSYDIPFHLRELRAYDLLLKKFLPIFHNANSWDLQVLRRDKLVDLGGGKLGLARSSPRRKDEDGEAYLKVSCSRLKAEKSVLLNGSAFVTVALEAVRPFRAPASEIGDYVTV